MCQFEGRSAVLRLIIPASHSRSADRVEKCGVAQACGRQGFVSRRQRRLRQLRPASLHKQLGAQSRDIETRCSYLHAENWCFKGCGSSVSECSDVSIRHPSLKARDESFRLFKAAFMQRRWSILDHESRQFCILHRNCLIYECSDTSIIAFEIKQFRCKYKLTTFVV